MPLRSIFVAPDALLMQPKSPTNHRIGSEARERVRRICLPSPPWPPTVLRLCAPLPGRALDSPGGARADGMTFASASSVTRQEFGNDVPKR
jgi:hypothetical protein